MCIDAHVPSGPRQVLVVPVRDVFIGLRVNILLRETKVDDVDGTLLAGDVSTNQEVLRLDIAEYQLLSVYVLHSGELRATYTRQNCTYGGTRK